MAHLIQDRYIKLAGSTPMAQLHFGVKGGTPQLFEGAMLQKDATGTVTRGGTGTGICVGLSTMNVDNSGGADGDLSVKALQGPFWMRNSAAADEITESDRLGPCFMVDDQQVAKTDGASSRGVAGVVLRIDPRKGVLVYIHAVDNAILAAAIA